MTDLTELAQSIAVHLGEDWFTLAADPAHDGRDLVHADGPHLRVRFTDSRCPTRVKVLGLFPGGARDRRGEPSCSITAATARGASAIAGDVHRRLLPDYLPALDRVRRFQEEQAAAASARRAVADRVQLLLPRARTTSSPPDSHIRADTVEWNPPGGPRLLLHMRDTPDTVGVELEEVPAETAVRICELLAEGGDSATSRPKAAAGLVDDFSSGPDAGVYRDDPPIEPRRPGISDVRAHLDRRVLVVTVDGGRSHGFLARANEEEIVLDPREDGAATVPFAEVAKVVPLRPRADAGIWTLTEDGLRPVYPALERRTEEDRG